MTQTPTTDPLAPAYSLSRPGFGAVLIPSLRAAGIGDCCQGTPSKYTPVFRRRAVEEVLDR